MSYAGEYGQNVQSKALRVTWKPQTSPPQYQTPTVDNVGEVITYTDITSPSNHISVDINTGEFEVLKNLQTAAFLVAAQISRGSGGSTDQWGMYFEILTNGVWTPAPDSTRYFTFTANSDDLIRHIAYDLAVSDVAKGTKLRVVQICTDAGDTLGLLTSKPFVNAPLSAGIIVSIKTVG